MTPMLITGPACEPLSLAEAKTWLRLDTTSEDDLVGALVTSARLVVEASTRRLLITQTWRFVLDEWPRSRVFDIPYAPFRSLVGIRVYDAGGEAQGLSTALYALAASPERARLTFSGPLPAPGQSANGIEIDAVFGYGDDAASVPEPLRQAIRLLTARWFENRGDVERDTAGADLPDPVGALVAPYRRVRLA
jgi:uncharacterized phiE125 gp8 family phage protein